MTTISSNTTSCHSFSLPTNGYSATQQRIMLGILPPAQIEEVLKKAIVGRIGCHADGETYVIPTSFVYDGEAIVCHGYEGKKIAMMRSNPRVCFQTDEMQDMGNWRSVMVQGRFEELKGKEERDKGLQALLGRNLPAVSSITTHLGTQWPFNSEDTAEIDGIVFRIVVSEKSGRFESSSFSPEVAY